MIRMAEQTIEDGEDATADSTFAGIVEDCWDGTEDSSRLCGWNRV